MSQKIHDSLLTAKEAANLLRLSTPFSLKRACVATAAGREARSLDTLCRGACVQWMKQISACRRSQR